MDINLSYADLVERVTSKSLSWQHSELADRYLVWAEDGNTTAYNTVIYKATAGPGVPDPEQEAINLADYLEKYAPTANKAITPPVLTTPNNNFMMQRNGCHTTFTAGQTGTLDFKIENYEGEEYVVKYLWGADFMAKDSEFFDWARFLIIDKDNVLGYGANVVIKEYVIKKYIFSNVHMECAAFAPGAVPVGLYLRCEYHSTGSSDVKFAINYHIETKDGE